MTPYDRRKCDDAIADRGAHAIIPPRKNAKPWKTVTACAGARNEALRASKYLGLALWRRWSGYHRRSRFETKMHYVKLLGQRLMARDFDRQVAELQVRIAVLNRQTALGIPFTDAVGYLHAWGTKSEAKAGDRTWIDFYNRKRPHSAFVTRTPAVAY